MKDYPDLFTLAKQHHGKILAPNFWNTNRVESFNSIFRSFSDLRRHFPCPDHSDANLRIVSALLQYHPTAIKTRRLSLPDRALWRKSSRKELGTTPL